MPCIFCRADASSSRSVEHIVPESLGNQSRVLPAGTVCDRCNAYFAVKVEKPLLESAWLTSLRFHEAIPSKRGRIPTVVGIHAESSVSVTACKTVDGATDIIVNERDEDRLCRSLDKQGKGRLVFCAEHPVPIPLVERFMAKCAVEMLAQRVMSTPDWRSALERQSELDPIRRFARFGDGDRWPVHIRRIYPSNTAFLFDDGNPEQVMHEYDLLYSDRNELYAVLILFGLEFSINLGGPELDGYLDWIQRFGGLSPLYTRKGRHQTS